MDRIFWALALALRDERDGRGSGRIEQRPTHEQIRRVGQFMWYTCMDTVVKQLAVDGIEELAFGDARPFQFQMLHEVGGGALQEHHVHLILLDARHDSRLVLGILEADAGKHVRCQAVVKAAQHPQGDFPLVCFDCDAAGHHILPGVEHRHLQVDLVVVNKLFLHVKFYRFGMTQVWFVLEAYNAVQILFALLRLAVSGLAIQVVSKNATAEAKLVSGWFHRKLHREEEEHPVLISVATVRFACLVPADEHESQVEQKTENAANHLHT